MKEEIIGLIAASRDVLALLRAGEPLGPKDHAVLTSLTWQLIAALHARKGMDGLDRQRLPADPFSSLDPKTQLPPMES